MIELIEAAERAQKRTLTSDDIRRQTEVFLAKGGAVTELPTGIPCTELDPSHFRRAQRQEIAIASHKRAR